MRTAIFLLALAAASNICGAPAGVNFAPSAGQIDCYDFIEVTVNVAAPDAANPFTDASVEGRFGLAGGQQAMVDGFCDSADGTVILIDFPPFESLTDSIQQIGYFMGASRARQLLAIVHSAAAAPTPALRQTRCEPLAGYQELELGFKN
jgi:hypothetical protein